MGKVGDAYDNAPAEAFFATLEMGLLMRQLLPNRVAAWLAFFEYIEGFCNRVDDTPRRGISRQPSTRGGGQGELLQPSSQPSTKPG